MLPDLRLFNFFIAMSDPKSHTLLTDLIYSIQVKPDILAFSETKLNENNVVNVDITGYNFFHTDSSIPMREVLQYMLTEIYKSHC